MSTELYLPPTHSPEYKKAADCAKMDRVRKFQTKKSHKLISIALSKAVDVFDTNGHYISTYPSYKEAAAACGTYGCSISRIITGRSKSANGYMFRKARVRKRDIKPLPPPDYTKMWAARPQYPYHRTCKVFYPDGTTAVYQTISDAAAAIGCSITTVWRMHKNGCSYKGITVKYIDEK